MSATLTKSQVALLREPHHAQLVTLHRDGSPHISPVWIDTDGDHILVNTQEGRIKIRNMRRNPRVAVGVFDQESPFLRTLNVTGRVVEVTREGAAEHIDFVSEKYAGRRPYPNHDPE